MSTEIAADRVIPSPEPADVADVIIIGAGPSGLFGAFYGGLREMNVKIIDALDEAGGQLTALYPEKFIYDVPGYPKIQSIDLVKNLVDQARNFKPTMCLGERVQTITKGADGLFSLTTTRGLHRSKSVVICGGVGAFQPKKLPNPELVQYEGKGLFYFCPFSLERRLGQS